MKLIVTADEAKVYGNWEEFCKIKCLDPYALANGMSEDEEFTLSLAEAVSCGVLASSQIKIIEDKLK